MRILYYATAYHARHGGSTHAKAFVEECRKNDLVLEIRVYPPSAPAGSQNTPQGFRKFLKKSAVVQPFLFWRRNKFHLAGIRTFIETFKPDVLHIRLDSNFLQIKTLRDWFPQLLITTEVNASPFDESFRDILFRPYFRKLERRCLSFADLNFFVSGELRKKIMDHDVIEARDFVVQNGVDVSLFRKKENSRPQTHEKWIVYIGTIDTHKQIDLLLKGFKKAHDIRPDLHLLLIGDGPALAEMRQLVNTLGIDARVRFTGWIKHQDIPAHLIGADIAIHHHANPYMSAIKIFEYMAMGLPVIGPDIPAVREVFADGENIILTSGTPDDVADKISTIMRDDLLRKKIGEQGHELVTRHYTWKANVSSILSRMREKLSEISPAA